MRSKAKLVCGVGINDANYITEKRAMVDGRNVRVWACPYVEKWRRVLKRCYSKKEQQRKPLYRGCTVCDDWLTFSNFKKWMVEQDWEGRQLDKDFLVEGNKVYSPSTCVFLPQKLNKFIILHNSARGDYPIGVSFQHKSSDMKNDLKKPYRCSINNMRGNPIYLGVYSDPMEAHNVLLEYKLKFCEDYLEEFKDESLIVQGLTRIRDKIRYHLDNNIELKDL